MTNSGGGAEYSGMAGPRRMRKAAERNTAGRNGARSMTAEEKIAHYEDALQRIVQWAEAYPETVFPAPDLLRAHALLQQGGMTLESISAHVGRHITEGIGKIAREALAEAYEESGR